MTIHIREATNRRGDVTAIATIVPDDYKRERKTVSAATTRDDVPNGGTWRDAWRAA